MGLAQQWVVETEEFIAAPFRVDGFGLYSSLPGPQGSRYTLERWFSFEALPPENGLAPGAASPTVKPWMCSEPAAG